jgi:hypothetical protein
VTVHANILIVGSSFFLCCLCLHVFLWRIRHPRNHLGVLLAVFFAPTAVFLLWALWSRAPFSGPDLFALMLLHSSLSCAYIQMYPACQANSPSLDILIEIGRSMPAGMTQRALQGHFDPKELFTARLRDLLDAELTRQTDGRLILTAKGRAFIMPFIYLRKILGLSAGKG